MLHLNSLIFFVVFHHSLYVLAAAAAAVVVSFMLSAVLHTYYQLSEYEQPARLAAVAPAASLRAYPEVERETARLVTFSVTWLTAHCSLLHVKRL